jgi:beta-glucosidase
MKHFIGYGRQLEKTEPLVLYRTSLRQFDLTIYQAAIKGVKSIMISSGEINGTPIHASKHLITDILKNELVRGVVVTDWKDIIYFTQDTSCRKNRDAVKIAVLAGIE